MSAMLYKCHHWGRGRGREGRGGRGIHIWRIMGQQKILLDFRDKLLGIKFPHTIRKLKFCYISPYRLDTNALKTRSSIKQCPLCCTSAPLGVHVHLEDNQIAENRVRLFTAGTCVQTNLSQDLVTNQIISDVRSCVYKWDCDVCTYVQPRK